MFLYTHECSSTHSIADGFAVMGGGGGGGCEKKKVKTGGILL